VEFYSNEYPRFLDKNENEIIVPTIKFQLHQGSETITLEALADTGCTGGLMLTEKQVALLKIDLSKWEKINDSPEPFELGDGRIVGTDFYEDVSINVNGEPLSVRMSIITDKPVLVTDEPDAPEETDWQQKKALEEWFGKLVTIGHRYFKHYDATFSGPNRKLSLSKKNPS
jgi:hypothetical protein